MMSTVGICRKILCWLPDVKRLTRYNAKVYTKFSQCKSASWTGLGGHRQVCGSNTQEKSIEVVCKRIQDEEAR